MRRAFVGAGVMTAAAAGWVAAVAVSGRGGTGTPPPSVPSGVPAVAPAPDALARPTTGFFAPPPELTLERARGVLAASPDGPPDEFHEFYFTRAMWRDTRPRSNPYILGDGGPAWSTDYPKGDRQFMQVVQRLSGVDASPEPNTVSLADPEIRRFPFLYTLEMGYAAFTEAEVEGLRSYLEAGGFLVVDDFWGSREWANFEKQMKRVFPDKKIVEVPRSHLLFRVYYDIDGDILQVPNLGNAIDITLGKPWATTSEQDGLVPHVRGIFDDDGRLMVAINWNTDLGDAWEHAENPYYPLKFSTFACELGLNMIIYGMSQ